MRHLRGTSPTIFWRLARIWRVLPEIGRGKGRNKLHLLGDPPFIMVLSYFEHNKFFDLCILICILGIKDDIIDIQNVRLKNMI
jgi:hypothetical protein